MVMERLTKRLEDGQAVMDCAACGVSWHKKREKDIPYCTTLFCRNRLKERLAAYEDTGLEPEDLKKAFNETAILKLAAQALSTTPDHLRDLIQAEKDERLVVLPCKVGDDVWFVRKFGKGQCIKRAKVSCINIDFRGEVFVSARRISGGYIGKTVFMTREEAEAALKGGDLPENRAD